MQNREQARQQGGESKNDQKSHGATEERDTSMIWEQSNTSLN